MVHRLDRPVSGIMVFAKTSKAASRLSEQVKNYTNIILKNAFRLYKCEMRERRKAKEKYSNLNDDDLLKIDLRDVFNNLGAEPTSTFSNGYWCKSPFRADNHPSFCVTDSYYFDASTGDKVYYLNREKAVYAAVLGAKLVESGLNIIGSHIDSPRLDLKPNPLFK